MSAQRSGLQSDAEWEGLMEAEVGRPLDTCNDLRSTEVKDMRGREQATRAPRSFTAGTGKTATARVRATLAQR